MSYVPPAWQWEINFGPMGLIPHLLLHLHTLLEDLVGTLSPERWRRFSGAVLS